MRPIRPGVFLDFRLAVPRANRRLEQHREAQSDEQTIVSERVSALLIAAFVGLGRQLCSLAGHERVHRLPLDEDQTRYSRAVRRLRVLFPTPRQGRFLPSTLADRPLRFRMRQAASRSRFSVWVLIPACMQSGVRQSFAPPRIIPDPNGARRQVMIEEQHYAGSRLADNAAMPE